MAWPIPWPCRGPHWRVRRMSMSRVPWSSSRRGSSEVLVISVDRLLFHTHDVYGLFHGSGVVRFAPKTGTNFGTAKDSAERSGSICFLARTSRARKDLPLGYAAPAKMAELLGRAAGVRGLPPEKLEPVGTQVP